MIRNAFTLIEMVFVIVTIAIFGAFGSDVFVNIYNNYMYSMIHNRLEARSEMALNVIAARLENRIRPSTIARDTSDLTDFVAVANAKENHNLLEWMDGFYESKISEDNTTLKPYFSALADLDHSDTNASQVHFANINQTDLNTLIDALSNSNASLDTSALIFRGADSDVKVDYAWDYKDIGNSQALSLHPINEGSDNNIKLPTGTTPIQLWEFADIIWTARSVVEENHAIVLYDNYRPWDGQKYSDESRYDARHKVTVNI